MPIKPQDLAAVKHYLSGNASPADFCKFSTNQRLLVAHAVLNAGRISLDQHESPLALLIEKIILQAAGIEGEFTRLRHREAKWFVAERPRYILRSAKLCLLTCDRLGQNARFLVEPEILSLLANNPELYVAARGLFARAAEAVTAELAQAARTKAFFDALLADPKHGRAFEMASRMTRNPDQWLEMARVIQDLYQEHIAGVTTPAP